MYQEIFSLTTPANPASFLDNAVDKVSSLLLLTVSLISWTARNTVTKIEQKIIKKTITCCLNSSPTDWLENCRCLNGKPGPEDFRSRHGGIHGNPCMGTSPVSSCRLAVTLNQSSGKILAKKVWNIWREGRAGSLICLHPHKLNCNRQLKSAKIRKKHMLIDLLQSAWIQMDSQKHRSKLLICHNQLESKTLAIDPQQSAKSTKIGLNTKCHACKREVPSARHHPASCHMCLGVIHWPQETQTHD